MLRGRRRVVENEAARAVEDDTASDKYASNLGLVRVGSKERQTKILSREEREEREREREEMAGKESKNPDERKESV